MNDDDMPPGGLDPDLIYKLVPMEDWSGIIAANAVSWSGVDKADGYMHLSPADELMETARRHYASFDKLLAIGISPAPFAQTLKWEPATGRDGVFFPHLYGDCPASAIRSVHQLDRQADGTFIVARELDITSGTDLREKSQ